VNIPDTGNLEARLRHAFNADAAKVHRAPAPGGDSHDFRWRSEIEAASAGSCAGAAWVTANSFTHLDEAAFGAGANVTPQTEQSQAIERELLERLFRGRRPDRLQTDRLY
jgi:hypothetical protein